MIGRSAVVSSLTAFVALALVLAVLSPVVTPAQQKGIARIGVLSALPAPPPTGPAPATHEPLLRGLRELGWIEGQHIALEYRFANWQLERLPELAAELVRANVAVIVTGGDRPILAARDATRSIPIVVYSCDPFETLVESLARPGGNVTGSTCLSAELSPKKLQFLKETVPGATRIAVLFNPDDALLVYPEFVTGRNRSKILEFAARHRLPAMYGFRESVDAGGLMSYGSNLQEQFYRTAFFVDKLLKGANPATMPIERPTRFELAVNLKTARAMGLAIPPSVLAQANVSGVTLAAEPRQPQPAAFAAAERLTPYAYVPLRLSQSRSQKPSGKSSTEPGRSRC
jgi:putative ABC transport system substrate-binding protein